MSSPGVPFCRRACPYITLQDPKKQTGVWASSLFLCSTNIYSALTMSQGQCQGLGTDQEAQQTQSLLLKASIFWGDGEASIATLTGRVPATHEPAGGLLSQPWQQ